MGVREISVQATREQSSTKQEQLGARVSTDDGREWVYVKNGAVALAPGTVIAAKDEVANHKNIAVAAAAAVGDTRVSVTLGATAAAAGLYEDGFMIVNDAAGEGIAYKIAGHAAIDSAGTGWIDLAEPIQVALTTDSQVTLHNDYEGVVVNPAGQADRPLGVANVAITAAYYGWIQTRGTCSVVTDDTITKGIPVTTGTNDAGSVEPLDAVAEPQVGLSTQAGVSGEYPAVYLTL